MKLCQIALSGIAIDFVSKCLPKVCKFQIYSQLLEFKSHRDETLANCSVSNRNRFCIERFAKSVQIALSGIAINFVFKDLPKMCKFQRYSQFLEF